MYLWCVNVQSVCQRLYEVVALNQHLYFQQKQEQLTDRYLQLNLLVEMLVEGERLKVAYVFPAG